MKRILRMAAFIACVAVGFSFIACGPKEPESIKIGINAPITGDIPKVGEGTKFAAQMWLEDINSAGGLEVAGKKYKVELVIEDNHSKAAILYDVASDYPKGVGGIL
jgi:branched-chain amino acid transport system substrate-binding protein